MADITYLPPETARPVPRGGAMRESILIDARSPAVARRLALEDRLLAATCPFDPHDRAGGIKPKDLELLLTISFERFGGDHALLRAQAVTALGDIDSHDARARLTELVLDPREPDGLRVTALAALGRAGKELAKHLKDDLSPLVRQAAAKHGRTKDERHGSPRRIPNEPEAGDDCCCCRGPAPG